MKKKMKKIVNIFLLIFLLSPVTVFADWADTSIEGVKEQGVMVGDPNGDFRADDYATRKELAVVANRIVKIDKSNYVIIENDQNWNLVFGASVLFLVLGIGIGYLICKKGNGSQNIEVKIPEIKIPDIVVPPSNIVNVPTKGVVVGGIETDDFFKEKAYIPKVESFNTDSDNLESNMQKGEIRGKKSASEIDDKVKNLKKMQRGEDK